MKLNAAEMKINLTDAEYDLMLKAIKNQIADLCTEVERDGNAEKKEELDKLTALNYYLHMGFKIGE